MNRKTGPFVRIHARFHNDECGFSLIETVIAVTVIFGSLITLAMSASTGFRYVGIGREQQAANQIANQLMEQARGLAFSKIQKGLMASALSTDPNLVTGCGTDPAGTYHLKTCAGDKVVSTNLTCPPPYTATDCSVPIVPSTGTVGETQDYPVDYTWHSYVTNNCPAVISATGCPAISPTRSRSSSRGPARAPRPRGCRASRRRACSIRRQAASTPPPTRSRHRASRSSTARP